MLATVTFAGRARGRTATPVGTRCVLAIASALVTACTLVPFNARTVGTSDAFRVAIAMLIVGVATFAALAYTGRGRVLVMLAGGTLLWLAVDVGLLALFSGGVATTSAIIVDTGLGLSGASGVVLARWAAVPRADERGIAESLIAAGAWLTVAAIGCVYSSSDLRRQVALLGGVIGAAAMLGGLTRAISERGGRRALGAIGRAGVAMLAWSGLLAIFGVLVLGVLAGTERRGPFVSPPCDLERRFFSTAGTQVVRATGHEVPGASEWRIRRSDSLAYTRVVACRGETDFVDSPELFARIVEREPDRDPERLAQLYDWVFFEGGETSLRIVDPPNVMKSPDTLVRPPEIRDNVLSFWREDTNRFWTAPTTRMIHHVVDLSSGRLSAVTEDDIMRAMRSEVASNDADLHAARLRADVAGTRALLAVASGDPSVDRRIVATVMVRGVADGSFAEPLLSLAGTDAIPEVRAAAIAALAATGDAALAARARELAKAETDPVAIAILRRDGSLGLGRAE